MAEGDSDLQVLTSHPELLPLLARFAAHLLMGRPSGPEYPVMPPSPSWAGELYREDERDAASDQFGLTERGRWQVESTAHSKQQAEFAGMARNGYDAGGGVHVPPVSAAPGAPQPVLPPVNGQQTGQDEHNTKLVGEHGAARME